MSGVMRATCSLICSRRSAGLLGKVAIWARARMNCSTASTNAERSSDLSPALPHSPAAFSIRASFSAVTRQDLRLALGDVSEVAFEGIADAGMQSASPLAQQRAISCVLY